MARGHQEEEGDGEIISGESKNEGLMMMTSVAREIPVYLRSRDRPKFVSGLQEDTTCRQVLESLLLLSEESCRVEDFVLVEQWRGVERPLAPDSRLLSLWDAWGEERARVRFVVKRVRRRRRARRKGDEDDDGVGHDDKEELFSPGFSPGATPPDDVVHPRQSRYRLRRRNSVSSNASDTLHPRKLLLQRQRMLQQQVQKSPKRSAQDLEGMMQVKLLSGSSTSTTIIIFASFFYLYVSGDHAPGSLPVSRADPDGPSRLHPPPLLVHPGHLRAGDVQQQQQHQPHLLLGRERRGGQQSRQPSGEVIIIVVVAPSGIFPIPLLPFPEIGS